MMAKIGRMGEVLKDRGVKNLTEAARELGISGTYINRIQKKLGFPRPIGQSGTESLFTKDDITKLARIKVLRLLGMKYDEIREHEKTNFIVEDNNFLIIRAAFLTAQINETVFKKHSKEERENNGILHRSALKKEESRTDLCSE